jgi:hypothetical protein
MVFFAIASPFGLKPSSVMNARRFTAFTSPCLRMKGIAHR